MSPRLRTALRFFHRWAGFPAGIFLFILCLTGALSCFSLEIQGWMQPRTALHFPLPDMTQAGMTQDGMTQTGLAEAARQMKAELDKGIFAFLKLPSPRDPVFRLWHYDGHVFLGPALAPDTGLPLGGHDVAGGSFFTTLHASLYLPPPWGLILIAVTGIILLLTLLSGLWLQLRRFLPDLLLFRPQAASQRRWLDFHLLGGSLALPVLFIIGLSGVVLQSQKLLHFISPAPHRAGHVSRHQARSTAPPPISPIILTTLTTAGMQQWGSVEDGFFMQTGRELGLYTPDTLHFCLQRQSLTPSHPMAPPRAICPNLHSFFIGLHNLRWAGPATRWLYSLSGLLGCMIIGSGMVLFLQSEKNSIAHGQHCMTARHILLRLYTALTTATILGLPLAILALFWSTRLPTSPPAIHISPVVWEERLFFGLWAFSLLHGLLCGHAARQQLAILAVLGIGMTGLDVLTRPFHTGRPLLFLAVDGLGALLGLGCLLALLAPMIAPHPPSRGHPGREQ